MAGFLASIPNEAIEFFNSEIVVVGTSWVNRLTTVRVEEIEGQLDVVNFILINTHPDVILGIETGCLDWSVGSRFTHDKIFY
jgi:hypothetical protein